MHIDSSTVWLGLGFLAQLIFSARFVVQWVASERARASVVPVAFWYLSLCGAALLLLYAIHRRDPVFVLGQGTGFLIYLRNLHLLRHPPSREAAARGQPGGLARTARDLDSEAAGTLRA